MTRRDVFAGAARLLSLVGLPLALARPGHIGATAPDADAITPAQALAALSQAMRNDPDYAWGWHCNIAMAAYDAGASHDRADAQAVSFMRRVFGVDTSRAPR